MEVILENLYLRTGTGWRTLFQFFSAPLIHMILLLQKESGKRSPAKGVWRKSVEKSGRSVRESDRKVTPNEKMEKGEKGRKWAKKADFSRFPGRGGQTPLKPPFVTPPFAAAQKVIELFLPASFCGTLTL